MFSMSIHWIGVLGGKQESFYEMQTLRKYKSSIHWNKHVANLGELGDLFDNQVAPSTAAEGELHHKI